MYAVDGTKGTVNSNVVQMKGNPFSSGSSGGAWIAKYTSPGGTLMHLAVGVNGGHNSEGMYSPLFINYDTFDLFNKIQDRERCD